MYTNREAYQYAQFINTINNINFINSSYRGIFDAAIGFNYGGENPIEFNNPAKINKYMVNAIRHNYTNYEDELKTIHKLKTVHNAYYRYKNSVLNNIAIKYPFLKNECDNQKRKIDMVRVVEKSTT